MSLLLAYTFNEQSVTPWDYSANKFTGASNNIAFVTGQNYGYAAQIGQGTLPSYISCTPTNFTSLATLSVFTSFNLVALPGTTAKGYLYHGNKHDLWINHNGTITFRITISSTVHTLTSATQILTGWNTIAAVFDGANMWVYINGNVDANTVAVTGAIDDTSGTVYIGNDSSSDTANMLIGNMDCIEFRNSALDQISINLLVASPGGILVSNTGHNFLMGDIIADNAVKYYGTVTWVVDDSTFYFYPLTQTASTYSKIGHLATSARQYYMELLNDFDGNGNGQLRIIYPIAGIADYASPANIITLDHRGMSEAPDNIQNMMAITSLRI